jgi:hypothetical protein
MLDQSIQELESGSLARIASAGSLEELEAVRVQVLGRKGALDQDRVDSVLCVHRTCDWDPDFARGGAGAFACQRTCIALVIGILTSPPADKPDLLGFLPGAFFWTIAFGVLPLNWLFRRRPVEKVTG